MAAKRFVITVSATGMGARTESFVREGAEMVGFHRGRGFRLIATAWAKHNITVNMICPVIRTDMYQTTWDSVMPEQLEAHDPAIRTAIQLDEKFGDPDRDFAGAVFLAGDGARFVTGQIFAVNGSVLMVR